jgi:hypothetical protein
MGWLTKEHFISSITNAIKTDGLLFFNFYGGLVFIAVGVLGIIFQIWFLSTLAPFYLGLGICSIVTVVIISLVTEYDLDKELQRITYVSEDKI